MDNTNKRFVIKVAPVAMLYCSQRCKSEYVVEYSQMLEKLQQIHKLGGKIISITQVP